MLIWSSELKLCQSMLLLWCAPARSERASQYQETWVEPKVSWSANFMIQVPGWYNWWRNTSGQDLTISASASTHLPSTLRIKETDSAPRRPPIANMDTVMDQRRVAVSAAIGSPYLSLHVLLKKALMYCNTRERWEKDTFQIHHSSFER